MGIDYATQPKRATNSRQRNNFPFFHRHLHARSAPPVSGSNANVDNLFHSWSRLILAGRWQASAVTGCRQASIRLSRQTEHNRDGGVAKTSRCIVQILDKDTQSERIQP